MRPIDFIYEYKLCGGVLTSCIGVLLPAVGLACELFTVGGELGPDSGLLVESKIDEKEEKKKIVVVQMF